MSDLRPKTRLKTSLKWTPFPAEFLEQIQKIFEENFQSQIQQYAEGSKFVTEGWIYPQELTLRVGLLEKGRLAQANFEISTEYDAQTEKFINHVYRCVDLAASLMEEYLSSKGEMELPRHWTKLDFEGAPLWMQFSSVNSTLEAEANALLGEKGGLLEEVEDLPDPTEEDEDPKKKLH